MPELHMIHLLLIISTVFFTVIRLLKIEMHVCNSFVLLLLLSLKSGLEFFGCPEMGGAELWLSFFFLTGASNSPVYSLKISDFVLLRCYFSGNVRFFKYR